jgi:hypothetical protein
MAQSQFAELIDQYLAQLVLRTVTRLNGTKEVPSSYFHQRMLTKEYSIDGKWASLSGNNGTVMADYVALDSSLPLKSRESMGQASGDISKLGLEMWLNEKQLREIQILRQQAGQKAEIARRIFADVPKVIKAVYERNEFMFLQGLSSGVAVADTDNTGTGVRLDYKYPSDHKYGVAALWSNPSTSTPIDDLQRMVDQASLEGETINRLMMDPYALNNLCKSTQMKDLHGVGISFGGDYSKIPSLKQSQLLEVLQDRFRIGGIEVVNWATRYEKNGQKTTVKPWAEGAVVALATDATVGSLVYTKLAEMDSPTKNVNYEIADDYILVSKFRENRPSIKEYTTSQAAVAPVIGKVDQIYLLDTKSVQA